MKADEFVISNKEINCRPRGFCIHPWVIPGLKIKSYRNRGHKAFITLYI